MSHRPRLCASLLLAFATAIPAATANAPSKLSSPEDIEKEFATVPCEDKDRLAAVKALSVIAMVGGLGPLLAPPIGGLTQEFWGWRGTLATLAAASVLMLVLAWVYVPESLPVSERRPANLRANFAAFGSLIAAPKYLWFMLAFVAGFSAMIASPVSPHRSSGSPITAASATAGSA